VVSCIEGFDAQARGQPKLAETPEAVVIQDCMGRSSPGGRGRAAKIHLQDLVDKRNAKQQVDIMYYI
jgi:Rrf2 family cysteine metabolism transcriptional repressor